MMTTPEVDFRRGQAATMEVRNTFREFAPTLGGPRVRRQASSFAPDLGWTMSPIHERVFQPQAMDATTLRFDHLADGTLRLPGWSIEFVDRAFSRPTAWWTGQGLEQSLHQRVVTLARNVHLSPRIIVTREASAFADAENVRTDADVVCRLALRLLPSAEKARLSVVHDHEDGRPNLHVTVRTSATVEDIVGAEDQLHDALFDRLPSANRLLFSIGYEFGG